MTAPQHITIPTMIDDKAVTPHAAHPGDAGHDLFAARDVIIEPGERVIVPTGIKIALPDGYVAMVCPRSGLAAKTSLIIPNAPGIIDAGYRGEIGVIMWNSSPNKTAHISQGDKIAQLVIVPYVRATFERVATLDETERGDGGFGSTGSSRADEANNERHTYKVDATFATGHYTQDQVNEFYAHAARLSAERKARLITAKLRGGHVAFVLPQVSRRDATDAARDFMRELLDRAGVRLNQLHVDVTR